MEHSNLREADSKSRAPGQKQAGELVVQLEPAGSPARAILERQVAAKFSTRYDAQLDHFYPFLLALKNAQRPLAIAGLRPARDGALFLENYLDCLAEQAVSSAFRTPVDRGQIVEIGNLVSTEPGASYVLFSVLAPLLRDAGFRWVICTATAQVEGMLNKMRLAPKRVCAASPERLGEEAANWGTYYESKPHVIVGDLELAASRLGRHPILSTFIDQLDGWTPSIHRLRRQQLS